VNVTRADRHRLEAISRIAARRRNTCGGPTSFLPPPKAAALPRSCPIGPIEARGVEMAGAFYDGGRRRADARHRAEGGRHGARTAAGRRNPLDRPDAGEDGGGVSLRSVQRILEAHQLAPHRIRMFKLSTDPKFADKLKDVTGLYVDPPAHAVVLSVDEKRSYGDWIATDALTE
jgi:hypothetical protein